MISATIATIEGRNTKKEILFNRSLFSLSSHACLTGHFFRLTIQMKACCWQVLRVTYVCYKPQLIVSFVRLSCWRNLLQAHWKKCQRNDRPTVNNEEAPQRLYSIESWNLAIVFSDCRWPVLNPHMSPVSYSICPLFSLCISNYIIL